MSQLHSILELFGWSGAAEDACCHIHNPSGEYAMWITERYIHIDAVMEELKARRSRDHSGTFQSDRQFSTTAVAAASMLWVENILYGRDRGEYFFADMLKMCWCLLIFDSVRKIWSVLFGVGFMVSK